MHVQADLISLAVVVLVALLSGMVFVCLRQPALVGYLLAGIVLGPLGDTAAPGDRAAAKTASAKPKRRRRKADPPTAP